MLHVATPTAGCSASIERPCAHRWGFCGAEASGSFTPCCSPDDSCFVQTRFYSQCAPTATPPPWSSGAVLSCPSTAAGLPADLDSAAGPALAAVSKMETMAKVDKGAAPGQSGPRLTIAPDCLAGCAEDWGACGGRGFSGWFSRCCSPVFACVRKNSFFSQCRPRNEAWPAHWPGAEVIQCGARPRWLVTYVVTHAWCLHGPN